MSIGIEEMTAKEGKDHHLQKVESACEQMKGDKRDMLHQFHFPGDPMNTLSDN
jgi:hypothetical protein